MDDRWPQRYSSANGMAASEPSVQTRSRGGDRVPVGGGAGGAAGGGDQPRRAPRHAAELSAAGDRQPRRARPRARSELPEQMLSYVGKALRHELRRFDRVGRPSERRARGAAARRRRSAWGDRRQARARALRAIKVEAEGKRRPLRVSVGLAAWREDVGGEELLPQSHGPPRAARTARLGPTRRSIISRRCSRDRSCGCCG